MLVNFRGLRKETLLRHNLVVFLLAALACALWGTAFPFIKLSYQALNLHAGDTYGEILFAAYRFLLAGLLVLGFTAIRRESLWLRSWRDWWAVLVLGLFQTSLQYYFFYVGLAHTTAVKGSVIGASGSFFAVVISHFVYANDKINWYKIIGLVTGFAGVILINLSKGSLDLDVTLFGEGYLVLSALVSTIGSVVAKNISGRISPLLATGYQLVLGALVLLAVAFTQVSPGHLQFNSFAWGMLLYLAFLSAAAFSIWYIILKYNPLGKIAIYRFLIPVFGVIFSAWFLPGEAISLQVLLSLGLVSVGIIAVNYPSLRAAIRRRQRQIHD